MHTLMSFGCTKTRIKASGVVVLMSAAFGGSANIINGKAWTETLRAYCLIIDVLLRSSHQSGAKIFQELSGYLETAREHPTGRLWLNCLIKPTLIALMLLRRYRNGDFLLQQHCLNAMLSHFFVAGHHNYAFCLSWYVRRIQHLPSACQRGRHTRLSAL